MSRPVISGPEGGVGRLVRRAADARGHRLPQPVNEAA
jgi:hypothetical protein